MTVLAGLLRRSGPDPGPGEPLFRRTGPVTAAGVLVDERTALTLSTVYACVRLVSDAVSTLPADVYRMAGRDRHPMETLPRLLTQPHPEMTRPEWLGRIMTSLLLQGNAYVKVVAVDRSGWPTIALPLHPDHVRVRRVDGQLTYTTPGEKASLAWPLGDIVHIRGLVLAGADMGLSPVAYARQSIGFALAAERFGASLFGSGGNPSGALKVPQTLTETQAEDLKTKWEAQFSGPSRRPAVLSGGVAWEAVSLTPEDCVDPSTLIEMADGSRRTADRLTEGDLILGFLEGRLASFPVERVRRLKVCARVRVETSRGRSVDVTYGHPFLVGPRSTSWVDASDLHVGDKVRVALGSGHRPAPISDEAWMVGAMNGNGHIPSERCVSFTTPVSEVAERLALVAERFGLTLKERPKEPVQFYFTSVGRGRRPGGGYPECAARAYFDTWGMLGHGAHDKVVPDRIWSGGPTMWAGFLSGWMDTDGWIGADDPNRGFEVNWHSVSEKLVRGGQQLLARLGINGTVRSAKMKWKGEIRPIWVLALYGKSEAAKLGAVLDLAHPRKRQRLEFWAAAPVSKRMPARHTDWDRIVAITPLPAAPMIAIQVAEVHNHVTNGLVTHNSQFLGLREFETAEVARWFAVPGMLIGDMSKQSSWAASVEALGIMFARYTLGPWLVRLEAALTSMLPTPQNVRFNIAGLLRADLATRFRAHATAIQWGWHSVNDTRALEDEPPVEGGDEYLRPLNMGLLTDPTIPDPASSDPGVNPPDPAAGGMAAADPALLAAVAASDRDVATRAEIVRLRGEVARLRSTRTWTVERDDLGRAVELVGVVDRNGHR